MRITGSGFRLEGQTVHGVVADTKFNDRGSRYFL